MNDKRRTLILVSRNLPPLRGGMERLNLHMAQGLAEHFRVVVIGPRGARAVLPASMDVRECGWGTLASFMLVAFFRTLSAAIPTRPAWVLAGSGLTVPIAWIVGRLSRAGVAAYVHGLDIVVPHPVYRSVWLPFIRRCDACIANSVNTARLARQAGVPADRIDIVHPGVEVAVEAPPDDMIGEFRERHDLVGRPVLLSVGRMTERKGLREFVLSAMPNILRRHPHAVLVVIGDEAPDALAGRATGAWSRLREEAGVLGLGDAVMHLGALDDDQLALAYAASDAHVFPIREVSGDVEGFGMVAVEAAAHGLPTVAFGIGGVPDAVSEGLTGYLVNPGDYDAFARRVSDVLDRRMAPAPLLEFAARFAWPIFHRRLFSILGKKR